MKPSYFRGKLGTASLYCFPGGKGRYWKASRMMNGLVFNFLFLHLCNKEKLHLSSPIKTKGSIGLLPAILWLCQPGGQGCASYNGAVTRWTRSQGAPGARQLSGAELWPRFLPWPGVRRLLTCLAPQYTVGTSRLWYSVVTSAQVQLYNTTVHIITGTDL